MVELWEYKNKNMALNRASGEAENLGELRNVFISQKLEGVPKSAEVDLRYLTKVDGQWGSWQRTTMAKDGGDTCYATIALPEGAQYKVVFDVHPRGKGFPYLYSQDGKNDLEIRGTVPSSADEKLHEVPLSQPPVQDEAPILLDSGDLLRMKQATPKDSGIQQAPEQTEPLTLDPDDVALVSRERDERIAQHHQEQIERHQEEVARQQSAIQTFIREQFARVAPQNNNNVQTEPQEPLELDQLDLYRMYRDRRRPTFETEVEEEPIRAAKPDVIETAAPNPKGDENKNDASEEDEDAGEFARRSIERGMKTVFERHGRMRPGEGDAGRKAHDELLATAETLLINARHTSKNVRRFIANDLAKEVERMHNEYIESRTDDLDESTIALLSTAKGRHKFRLEAFSILCDKQQLGLKPKDKLDGPATAAELDAHMRKKLGENYETFRDAVSRFDGSKVADALTNMVSQVAENTSGLEMRAEERASLMKKIGTRLKNDLQEGKSGEEASKGRKVMRGFLSLGGEAVLKYAAVAAAVGVWGATSGITAPLAAGALGWTLWSGKGLTQAAGYDFGKAIENAALMPFGRSKKQNRLSLPWSVRAKLIWRDVLTIPRVLKWIPKIKSVVPDNPINISQAQSENGSKDISTVTAACTSALETLNKKAHKAKSKEKAA